MNRPSYVYFIKPVGMDGPVKIGCSECPLDRLATLATWSPFPLEIVATVPGEYADEQFLHSCFAGTHSHREWFRASSLLSATIARVKREKSLGWIRSELKPIGSIRKRGKGARPCPAYLEGYRSYACRVRWAEKKLRALGEDAAWHAPYDVSAIIQRWIGQPYRHVDGVRPSKAEFARLDEYLSDPASHSVIPEWRRRKVAA